MNLTYIGYSQNGLGNQFCSLQLFSGLLAHYKDISLDLVWKLPYNNIQDPQGESRNKVNTSKIDKYLDNSKTPTLFDLVDFNYDNYTLHNNDWFLKERSTINLINTQQSYINVSGNNVNEQQFSCGKQRIELKEDKNNVLNMTLIWYSRFFYDRSKDIDSNLSRFKFKKEYYDLAEKIAKHYGKFNGTQIRIMPDHHQYYKFSKDILEAGLEKFDNKSLPILCSVDDFNHKDINNDRLILIEDILFTEFLDDFKQLEYQHRITVALISALVMSMAEDFVGTPFSTFSTMIYQLRNNRIDEQWKYYPSSNQIFSSYNAETKPYSWSNIGGTVSWERDWKESKLNV
jgi:hypothetical protein